MQWESTSVREAGSFQRMLLQFHSEQNDFLLRQIIVCVPGNVCQFFCITSVELDMQQYILSWSVVGIH